MGKKRSDPDSGGLIEEGCTSLSDGEGQDEAPSMDTPPPGDGHFARKKGELDKDHQAFLLWAMQTPAARSQRLTSIALSMSTTTLRRRMVKWKWRKRVKEVAGATGSDVLAWRQYLNSYANEYGVAAVAAVQKNMVIAGPLTPLAIIREKLGIKADPVGHAKDSAARAALEDLPGVSSESVGDLSGAADSPPPQGSRMERRLKLAKFVDGTLDVYGAQVERALKSKKGKGLAVRPTDLPVLIALSDELHGVGGDESSGPRESVRVRIARENDEDLLEALNDDSKEIAAILRALNNKRAQDEVHDAQQREILIEQGRVVELVS